MVYCGKPSRGCQMCRTRRIKCDETKPTCNQCQKSRRQCPGYKDDFDLVFRNETKATERRARRSVKKKERSASDASAWSTNHQRVSSSSTVSSPSDLDGHTVHTPGSDSDSSTSLVLPGTLTMPVEQQAPCFFMSNFVILPHNQHSKGYFDFILPLMKTEPTDSPLSLSFRAVAMASLANRPNTRDSRMMNQAVDGYTKALKGVNLSLQNPTLQKSDSTLASVILLSFFETLSQSKANIPAWGSHIDGAVQLIKMRGRKQLRTRAGLALFQTIRTQMLINCHAQTRPPTLGTDWWVSDAAKDEDSELWKLNLRVAELRSEITSLLGATPRTAESFAHVHDIMQRAQTLDREFQHWADSVPDRLRVATVAWIDNVPGGDLQQADVCPGKVDMYEDLFASSLWNMARVSRVFLSGIIIRCAAWLAFPVDYRTTPEYAHYSRLGQEHIIDIIASIPYHLGNRWENGELNMKSHEGLLGGFFVIWPLIIAACSDFTTDNQRAWIRGRFKYIGEYMGMNQAKVTGALQLRLPSMIVHRDNLGHAAQIASTKKRDCITQDGVTPAKITKSLTFSIEKREREQREIWERERRELVSKAVNDNNMGNNRTGTWANIVQNMPDKQKYAWLDGLGWWEKV